MLPRGLQRLAHDGSPGCTQVDQRGPFPTPFTLYRGKCFVVNPDVEGLLIGVEHHDGEGIVRIAEGCKDLSTYTKIGMRVVKGLNRFRKAQSDLSELGWSHGHILA